MRTSGDSPRMRVIGMLGGMSWESSAQYYRLVNELARERLSGLHSARLVLVSVDFAEIEQLQVTGQWERAGELLAEAAESAEAAGAELAVKCSAVGATHSSSARPWRIGCVTSSALSNSVVLIGTPRLDATWNMNWHSS